MFFATYDWRRTVEDVAAEGGHFGGLKKVWEWVKKKLATEEIKKMNCY